jgi:hypothetical protein
VVSLQQAAQKEFAGAGSFYMEAAGNALQDHNTPLVTGQQVRNIINAWSVINDFSGTAKQSERELGIAKANGVPTPEAITAISSTLRATAILNEK